MIEPHDGRFVIGFQTEAPGDDVDWQYLDEVIMRFVNDFIRTEKLKLLAEVKSSLTQLKELKENRDDKGVLWGSYDVVDLDDIREVLTKLEAEL